MLLCAVSDLHGRLPVIPECDILVIAGDLCPDYYARMHDNHVMRLRQMEWLRDVYVPWEQSVPAKHILVTPGNHDWVTGLPANSRSHFHIDELVHVGPYKFWLTPWISPVGDWNYMLMRDQRKARFAEIPEGLDVLVSHSPAHKVLDKNFMGEHCGCPELRQAIYRAKPKVCVFGHIHEGCRETQGRAKLGDTRMFNVAMYGNAAQPLVLDLATGSVKS